MGTCAPAIDEALPHVSHVRGAQAIEPEHVHRRELVDGVADVFDQGVLDLPTFFGGFLQRH